MTTMSDYERVRLVLLGGTGVGKTCIVKRFLTNSYTDKYRTTVEDLFSREYELGYMTLKVDILDTSGDMQFPAMRKLNIATAHAFVLVYAVTSISSFESVKQYFEEIREQRSDYQEIPFIVVGNKLDLASSHRQVNIEDVSEWIYCELPKLRVKVLECSAKDDTNVRGIFQALLNLSRLFSVTSSLESAGLKRRSSAYVSKKRGKSDSVGSDEKKIDSKSSEGEKSVIKPRSRSLIRRASGKTKHKIRDSNNTKEDCIVS